MSLLKRLVIIFSSVTIVCSVCFYFIGDKMIEEMSSGEVDRGSGRARGVVSSINREVSKRSSNVFEFSNYLNIENSLKATMNINLKKIIKKLKRL
ncbi:MAG: hypothetical protein ACRCTZ_03380 [Sarcina sp.]